jgi:hypothetical protein
MRERMGMRMRMRMDVGEMASCKTFRADGSSELARILYSMSE